jgi:hypothetical protein
MHCSDPQPTGGKSRPDINGHISEHITAYWLENTPGNKGQKSMGYFRMMLNIGWGNTSEKRARY